MKLICVCTGNTCRSPMMENIIRYYLRENSITDIDVTSGGIMVDTNSVMSENSQKALDELSIPYIVKNAHQLTLNDILNADLILCMTREHKMMLPPLDKIICVGEIKDCCDIADPYGQSEQVYLTTAKYMLNIADKIICFIKNITNATL